MTDERYDYYQSQQQKAKVAHAGKRHQRSTKKSGLHTLTILL